MRIICPECDANYRVDPNAVSPQGAQVQCSHCWHIWTFIPYPDSEKVEATPARARPKMRPEMQHDTLPALPSQSLSAEALSVIHEEAEREITARHSDEAAQNNQEREAQGYIFLKEDAHPAHKLPDATRIKRTMVKKHTRSRAPKVLFIILLAFSTLAIAAYWRIDFLKAHFPEYEVMLSKFQTQTDATFSSINTIAHEQFNNAQMKWGSLTGLISNTFK